MKFSRTLEICIGNLMNNRFTTLVFIMICLFCTNLWAAPAAPVEIELIQPDGTTFTAIPRGDEYASWVETLGGHTIVKINDTWYYAEKDGEGKLRATNARVGDLSQFELESMPLHLAPKPVPEAFEQRKVRKLPKNDTTFDSEFSESLLAPHTQFVLTVLVDYTDIGFTYIDPSFQSLIYGASGSVNDFFLENSYDMFTVTAPTESFGTANDGIIHVTRPVTHPNQGKDSSISRAEAREIVSLTDSYIDYSAYDTNGDGTVSSNELSIVLIIAGYENSFGGDPGALTPRVWGHKSSFASSLALDGVALRPYTMFGEAHATSLPGKHQATIGIMCHELGHLMLRLPDLYDTDGSSEGIGKWGLMGGGSWNTMGTWSGDSPSHMSAWSKVATGFTTPEDIDIDQLAVSLDKADANEAAKRIWIDKYKRNEYFLLENRQLSGFDVGLPGSGLLLWHIDDYQTSNRDETHKRVDVEAADGNTDLDTKANRGDAGDPFPGTSSNTSFNDASTPNSKNYSGATTDIGVTDISPSSVTMTADIAALSGGLGDNVSYDGGTVASAIGYPGSTTAWIGIDFLNDTDHTSFDGIDVYVNDTVGATIDINYYTSMVGGTPAGPLHSETGFAAGPGWNRLLLATPQDFPMGVERGVVLKIVNVSGLAPIVYNGLGVGSGRSFVDADGIGAFFPLCPSTVCGDLNLVVLLSSSDVIPSPPVATAASEITSDSFQANWNSSGGATDYRLDVSLSSSFDSFVSGYNDLDVAGVILESVTGLTPDSMYYYRVRANNIAGISGNSNTISLTTAPAIAACNLNTVPSVTEIFDITHEACEMLILGPDFIAGSGATVSVNSGWEIDFLPGFIVETGATLRANVCGQSLCMISAFPMPAGCHSCVDQICAIDSSCCDTEFGVSCLEKVASVCGLVCEDP